MTVHDKNFCPNVVVKSCQNSQAKPRAALILPHREAPKPAPHKVLRQLDNEAQAIAVSMQACGAKLAYIAAALGKSESYISLLRSGKRPVPEWFVKPFCHITGSLLLRQFRDLQEALNAADAKREVIRLADLLRNAA